MSLSGKSNVLAAKKPLKKEMNALFAVHPSKKRGKKELKARLIRKAEEKDIMLDSLIMFLTEKRYT
jgi:hypothetical protein